jgi:hypothetical protein
MASAIRLILIFAVLNLTWEVLQLPFYTLWNSGTAGEIAYAVIHCTGGDVLIGVFVAVISTSRSESRAVSTSKVMAIPHALHRAWLAYTIFSEWLNVSVVKSWAYSDLMPLIPPLGTGLTPILQWIIVPLLTWASADQAIRQLLCASRTKQGASP